MTGDEMGSLAFIHLDRESTRRLMRHIFESNGRQSAQIYNVLLSFFPVHCHIGTAYSPTKQEKSACAEVRAHYMGTHGTFF